MTSTQKTTMEPWWELRVHVPAELCEDLSSMLIEDGAMGVQTLDAHAPVPHAPRGHASLGPQSQATPKSLVVPESAEAWAQSVAPKVTAHGVLVASYAGTYSRSEVLELATAALSPFGQLAALADAKLISRCDDAWAHSWKQYFKPQKLGRRLWVVPSWEDKFEPPTGSLALRIDPGMAFGTGQHATTALCMRALESHLDGLSDAHKRKLKLLDVGCGSGVLALTALVLGVPHVTAIDIDPLAEAATVENLERMGLAHRADVSLTPVDQLTERYPLVTANILAPTLIAMARPLAARVAQGGLLVLSGILVPQAEEVLAAFLSLGTQAQGGPWALHQRLQHEGWAALVLRKV
jgi:ribosomal protein L11 methyltransferase